MEKEEDRIPNNVIDDALSLIDGGQVVEKKEVLPAEKTVKPAERFDIDDLTAGVLKSVDDVNKKTDEVYDMFYTPIALGKDRSDVSKQSLMDSIRLKNEAMANVTAIINAKAKLVAAQNQQANKMGVIIQAQSGADVGINLDNLS